MIVAPIPITLTLARVGMIPIYVGAAILFPIHVVSAVLIAIPLVVISVA